MPGIKHIEYYLPETVLSNEAFAHLGVDPVFMREKIGIDRRHISAPTESVGDMAVAACRRLFERRPVPPRSIDFLILCTQNPDYQLPTTACVVQHALGLRRDTSCFDLNQGCSGFVYALAVGLALMEKFGWLRGIVVTSEAYSKVISYEDKTTATLFSDGAAATLLDRDAPGCVCEHFNFGTDGSGGKNLIVPVSGSRHKRTDKTRELREYGPGIRRSDEHLFMDGHEITKFVWKEVPASVERLVKQAGVPLAAVDRFFFHQANRYILETLAARMQLRREKVVIDLAEGNTVSSTIPIALKNFYSGRAMPGPELAVVSGFGVGYSWAAAVIRVGQDFGEMV